MQRQIDDVDGKRVGLEIEFTDETSHGNSSNQGSALGELVMHTKSLLRNSVDCLLVLYLQNIQIQQTNTLAFTRLM